MRKSIYTIVLLLLAVNMNAQDFQQVLDSIRSQHPGIKALEQQARAGKLTTRTGNYPGPLSVSYGYFPENSTVIGTKETVGITQNFDFPTLYGARKDEAETQRNLINTEKQQWVQEEMLRVAHLVTDYVAAAKGAEEFAKRQENAQKLKEAYEKAFAEGEVSALEVNKVRVHALQMAKALRLQEAEQEGLKQELEALAGQGALPEMPEVYAAQTLGSYEAVLEARLAGLPQMTQAQNLETAAKARVRVEKHANLPGLSVGYASESVADESFKGVTMG
ncbi:MAG: TolC family protein, partial [Bacteroidota bacterium]